MTVKPYNTGQTKKEEVREMFDNIAPKYDLLNHTLSMNIDRIWRRRVVRIVCRSRPHRILDVATGTGDLAIEMARRIRDVHVLGVDLSEKMLDVARCKVAARGLDERVVLDVGDAEHLRVSDASVDVVTVAFGVRNFGDLEAGLREMARTIKPGGKVVILEFSRPRNRLFRVLYEFYTYKILPRIGGMVSAFDVAELEKYLEKDHDFKYAALVHCDTPSGMLNDVSKLCPLLKKYGILTLVDSVSAMFGEEMRVDDYQIDLLCGGSQKAVSAPPGLSFVTISADAYKAMHSRKTPVASFYANIVAFDGYYEKKWFPYTMPISDIYGLRQAFDNIKNDPYMLERHAKIGNAVRAAVKEAGLELYQETGFSNTVTVFNVPEGTTDTAILTAMKEKCNIMLAGSFGAFSGKVIRIGHMGENAYPEKVGAVMAGLDLVFKDLGITLKCSLKEAYDREMSEQ